MKKSDRNTKKKQIDAKSSPKIHEEGSLGRRKQTGQKNQIDAKPSPKRRNRRRKKNQKGSRQTTNGGNQSGAHGRRMKAKRKRRW